MKRILGLIFLLMLALPALAHAQTYHTLTGTGSSTLTCSATSGSSISIDIFAGTLSGNAAPTLPAAAAGCHDQDRIHISATQGTNGSFTLTPTAGAGTNLSGPSPLPMPTSTGSSTDTVLDLIFKYNTTPSTPEWQLVEQRIGPSGNFNACVLNSFPASGCVDQPGVCTICTITSAQLLALDGTGAHAITIIPAQGANIIQQVTAQRAEYIAGTTPYVNGGAVVGGRPQAGSGGGFGLFYSGQTIGNTFQILTLTSGLTVSWLLANTWWTLPSNLLYVGGTPFFSPISTFTNKAVLADIPTTTPLEQTGPITSASVNAGGTGYIVGDTGTITDVFGTVAGYCSSQDATYVITGISPVTFNVTSPGTFYALSSGFCVTSNQPYETATGGAQPGIGTGLLVNVDSATLTGSTGYVHLRTFYSNAAVVP